MVMKEQLVGWAGIVYDTGGLIKSKTGMPGENDMAGSRRLVSRVLERYPASVGRTVVSRRERIGPNATRPDDILSLYSGLTVEEQHYAEADYLLTDGVYARHYNDVITIYDFDRRTTGMIQHTLQSCVTMKTSRSQTQSWSIDGRPRSPYLTVLSSSKRNSRAR